MDLSEDRLVSRSFILNHLNLTHTDFNKLQGSRFLPFPKPVLDYPAPRWALKEINAFLKRSATRIRRRNKGDHYIVMFGKQSRYGQIRDPEIAAMIKAIPELMVYADHYVRTMEESYQEEIELWGPDEVSFHPLEWEKDVLVNISKVPRHHPKLVELVQSISPEKRQGLRLCRIPYSSYSYHEQEDGTEVYASYNANYNTDIIAPPGEDGQLFIKMLPTITVHDVLERYKEGATGDLLKLINELDSVLDK